MISWCVSVNEIIRYHSHGRRVDVSQRTRIMNVKLDQASMYVGLSPSKQSQWTRNPGKALRFLCDAWQSVFNACRAHRMEWEYENGVKTGEHPLGRHTDTMPRPNTQADARACPASCCIPRSGRRTRHGTRD